MPSLMGPLGSVLGLTEPRPASVSPAVAPCEPRFAGHQPRPRALLPLLHQSRRTGSGRGSRALWLWSRDETTGPGAWSRGPGAPREVWESCGPRTGKAGAEPGKDQAEAWKRRDSGSQQALPGRGLSR